MNDQEVDNTVKEYLQKIFIKKHLNSAEKEFLHELEAHIWDLYDMYLDEGYDNDKAIKKAVQDIGEPDKLQNCFKRDIVSKKVVVFSISLLIMIFVGFSYKVYYDTGDLNALIKNICWLLAGILLIFGMHFINIDKLRKYAFLIICIFVLTDFLLTIFLVSTYGRVPYNYKIVWCFVYLVFGGYQLEDFESLNIVKRKLGLLSILASLILALFSNQKVSLLVLVLGYFILAIQLRKQKTGKYIFGLLGIFFFMILGICGAILIWGDDHQVNSLLMLLRMKRHSTLENNQAQVRRIFLESNFFQKGNVESIKKMGEDGLYILTYIVGKFGFFSLLLIGILYAAQIYIMIRRINFYEKEKDVGVMLLSIYIFRILYSLLMNLDVVPITSIGLPILSYDRWIFIFDCCSIGYLLDTFIYRRRWKANFTA